MTVDTADLVKAMTRHWERELKNVTSKELQNIWFQIANTFNHQIKNKNQSQWQILQPPTGTGKTQCIAVYCSLLAKMPTRIDINRIRNRLPRLPMHPGVLIVTRLISEADSLAELINTLSGRKTAVAVHRENRLSVPELKLAPVLVVTHSAYQQALRKVAEDEDNVGGWLRIHSWQQLARSLVIIDEALDFVDYSSVDVENMKHTLSHIPDYIRERHTTEINYLKRLLYWMRNVSCNHSREHMVPTDSILVEQPDFTNLRKAVRGARLDRNVLRTNGPSANRSLHETIGATLDAIEVMASRWCWFLQSGTRGTLNAARFILPESHKGAVVMDATASTNLVYQIFKERAFIIPTPEGARRYENVTLHVSENHKVGKVFLRDNAKREGRKLIDELKSIIPGSKKVFVCCHKAVEPYLVGYDDLFHDYDVGHWGAIDGRNDWQSFDTAVIFGLPYRNKAWAPNTFMAINGPQSDEWLNSRGDRPFGDIQDIREALEIGAISARVVQAINRTHCRRVIDGKGNCLPTDIYLLLPGGTLGKVVLSNIQKSMPGISTVDWKYGGASKKVRKSKHDDSLVRYLEGQLSGRIPANEVRLELGIPKRTFESLVRKIKNSTTSLYDQLTNLGIAYEVLGVGRGARSYFVKT